MNIFISWSGKLSEQLAVQIKEWLPNVIQRARPFISNESIRKGQKWFLEISKELSIVNFGIICLTKDNIEAPWLLFEAGALSKQIEDSHVCPILFGGLKPKDITGPLSNFQHTIFNKDDFFKLILTINTNLSETEKLSEMLLANAFEKWWPDLENSISKILKAVKGPQAPSKIRSDSDILEEVLYLTREMSKSNLEILRAQKIINQFGGIEFSNFNSDTEVFYKGDNFNHPIRVRIFPYDSELGSEAGDKQIIITRAGVNLEDFNEEYYSRGVTIEILFWDEVGGFWTASFSFHKGQTFFKTKQVKATKSFLNEIKDTKDIKDFEADNFEAFHVIWRS